MKINIIRKMFTEILYGQHNRPFENIMKWIFRMIENRKAKKSTSSSSVSSEENTFCFMQMLFMNPTCLFVEVYKKLSFMIELRKNTDKKRETKYRCIDI